MDEIALALVQGAGFQFALHDWRDGPALCEQDMARRVAQALREARRQALAEAAREADAIQHRNIAINGAIAYGAQLSAAAIRALMDG